MAPEAAVVHLELLAVLVAAPDTWPEQYDITPSHFRPAARE
jgi:hypothetical protein